MTKEYVTPPKHRGLKRFWFATQYSLKGLKAAYCKEPAFRYEVYAALVLIPLAIYLGENLKDQTMLIASVLFVWVVELLNSGVEAVVDRVGYERHELAGRAKDLGSAAVFIALIITALIWAGILL